MKFRLNVNGTVREVDAEPDEPLLWVLREQLSLTGTKFACGRGLCGSCTVHLDGQPVRSCSLPARSAAGRRVTTIEGVAASPVGRRVQQAWIAEDAPQCGYCQSGQIMSATALLAAKPAPTDADIDAAMLGNLCRCAAYPRIRAAIKRASRG